MSEERKDNGVPRRDDSPTQAFLLVLLGERKGTNTQAAQANKALRHRQRQATKRREGGRRP